jgi:hypothetical protein
MQASIAFSPEVPPSSLVAVETAGAVNSADLPEMVKVEVDADAMEILPSSSRLAIYAKESANLAKIILLLE